MKKLLKTKENIAFKRIFEFNSDELNKIITNKIFKKKGKSKNVLLYPLMCKKFITVKITK